jgi:hypothetical protein
VVAAAGNGGSRDLHAGGFVLDGSVTLRMPFSSGATADDRLSVDLWFDGPPPALTVIAPDGHAYGPVASGAMFDSGNSGDGRVVVGNASGGADPVSGRYDAAVTVTSGGAAQVAAGEWHLVLDGKATRWDAWLTDVPAGGATPRFLDQLDPDERAQSPAFSAAVIAVGSYVSRTGWTNVAGKAITRTGVVGRPSTFSGTGPSVDGRFVPDVAAPGDFILSAMSSDAGSTVPTSVFYSKTDPDYLVSDDGMHGALRGTSQASPHVTGAVALLYALDSTLTTDRIRELLRTAARPAPGDPGFSTRSGFGHLDVLAAARLLRHVPAGPVDAAASSVGMSRDAIPIGSRSTVSVVPRDASGAPLGSGHAVDVESDAGGFAGPVSDAGEGRYERILVAEGPQGAAATLRITVDGTQLDAHPQVWFVADRTQIGQPFEATGGCRAATGGGAAAIPLVVLGVLLLRLPRRRRG